MAGRWWHAGAYHAKSRLIVILVSLVSLAWILIGTIWTFGLLRQRRPMPA